MKIIDSSLEKTLEHLAGDSSSVAGFPADHAKRCYYKRYESLSDKLHADFHSHVVVGAATVDGGVLTDHGSDHINTVIQRAGLLLDYEGSHPGYELSPFEIYLLLIAIHFHDLGNMLGREDHEKRIELMMGAVSSHLGDETEKKFIRNIAAVHGGEIDGDKDTISYLNLSEPVNGKDVRPQLLAAILRFADELSDDSLRATRILQALKVIPKESEIFHKYASCLHSVMVRHGDKLVDLCFNIHVKDLVVKFGKKEKDGTISSVFLIDEIFKRTVKTHLERVYCSRHMFPAVDVRAVCVKIEFSKDNEHPGVQLPQIAYRLEERGYPQMKIEELHKACVSLQSWDGSDVDVNGDVLSNWADKILSQDKSKGADNA